MKLLTTLSLAVLIMGCSSPTTEDGQTTVENTASTKAASGNAEQQTDRQSENDVSEPVTYVISSYDDPEVSDRIEEHKTSLKKLHDSGIFTSIHTKISQKISSKHREYFNSHSEYVLLSYAKGSLFPENKPDYSFAVYNKNDRRVYILIYRESNGTYARLFTELKVENGLQDANCNYGAFGTLDYQLANELIYQEDYLSKSANEFVTAGPLKIADLSKDDTFYLEEGCFSKKFPKKDTSNSLCISTSSVYNNWETLKYRPGTNTFIIYYGQAFAD